jgi:hypothetical protein
MRKSTLSRTFALLFLVILTGCKVKKGIIEQATLPAPPNNSLSVLDNIIASQAKFNTLSIRAKADLEIDNNSYNATMIIHAERDKAIWISVTAPIIGEVGRAMITPDSVKILNRLEGEYVKKPFSYIHELANEQVNFNTLQAMIAGNAIPEVLNNKSSIEMKGRESVLSATIQGLIYTLNFDEKFRLTQTDLRDNSAGQRLNVAYGDFDLVSEQTIPQSVNVRSASPGKKINVDLKYSRIELNVPVDMPFNVPSRFNVKQ